MSPQHLKAKRCFPTWRRLMRTYDAAEKYQDRAVVTPELSNSQHFGTSS